MTNWHPTHDIELVAGTPAGGGNSWDYPATKTGNGHVLAINSPTIVTNKLLGESALAYSDLTPLATLYTEYLAFVVRPDSALRNPGDLAARLGRDPAGLPIA